mgnify:FL=1
MTTIQVLYSIIVWSFSLFLCVTLVINMREFIKTSISWKYDWPVIVLWVCELALTVILILVPFIFFM